jgi:hypothetical protein
MCRCGPPQCLSHSRWPGWFLRCFWVHRETRPMQPVTHPFFRHIWKVVYRLYSCFFKCFFCFITKNVLANSWSRGSMVDFTPREGVKSEPAGGEEDAEAKPGGQGNIDVEKTCWESCSENDPWSNDHQWSTNGGFSLHLRLGSIALLDSQRGQTDGAVLVNQSWIYELLQPRL